MSRQASFANRIRERIKADPRTIYRISKDAGIAPTVLQRFMLRERENITIQTAEKLCRVIGLDLRPVEEK